MKGKNLLLREQKACRKGSRGTKDQLLIDKMIIKNCKKTRNIIGSCIDHRKAYDKVPQNWIKKSMKMFRVVTTIWQLVSESMNLWNTEFTGKPRSSKPRNVKIKRGIFQGDSL